MAGGKPSSMSFWFILLALGLDSFWLPGDLQVVEQDNAWRFINQSEQSEAWVGAQMVSLRKTQAEANAHLL